MKVFRECSRNQVPTRAGPGLGQDGGGRIKAVGDGGLRSRGPRAGSEDEEARCKREEGS